jgi:hypothetical protein
MLMTTSKLPIGNPLQVCGVAFLKLQIRQTVFGGAPVSRLNQIPRDIDPEHFRAELELTAAPLCRPATQIENLKPFGNSDSLH